MSWDTIFLLAQAEQDSGGIGQIIGVVIWLAILILAIAGL
jgi:hypothetical protein